jgi:hypothetical protein
MMKNKGGNRQRDVSDYENKDRFINMNDFAPSRVGNDSAKNEGGEVSYGRADSASQMSIPNLNLHEMADEDLMEAESRQA